MVYAVFVDEISCADVVMFLSLPLRTPTEQKKRGSFFKKSPTFFENSPTFFEKARTFFARFSVNSWNAFGGFSLFLGVFELLNRSEEHTSELQSQR